MCEVYSSLLNIVLVNKSYGDPDFCKDSVVHGLYSSSFAKCVFLLFTSLDCLSTASVDDPDYFCMKSGRQYRGAMDINFTRPF